MRKHALATVAGVLCLTGQVFAACAPPYLNQNAISAALTGNTVCVGTSSNWEAQELHVSGGDLTDYKRGPSHPTDPTKTIGSWRTNSGNTLTHDYGGGTSYTYQVKSNGGASYSFCSATGAEIIATVKTGSGPC